MMTDSSGVFNPLVRELCQTCGWRGGHGSDCPELDRPGSPLFDFDEIRARLAEQDRIEEAAEASSAGASKVAAATGTAAVPGPVYAGLTLGMGPAEEWMGQWQAGHLCPVPKVREHLTGLCAIVVEASFCTRCSSVHYDFCQPQHTSFAACETCDLSGYNYVFLFPYFLRNSALHPTTSPHRARLLAPCLLPRIYTGCRYTSATCS